MERFVVWSPEQRGNILSLDNESTDDVCFGCWDVLTEVNTRLARDRSELWRSAGSRSVGLLRHGGPWLHTRSAGLLPLKGRRGVKKKRKMEKK